MRGEVFLLRLGGCDRLRRAALAVRQVVEDRDERLRDELAIPVVEPVERVGLLQQPANELAHVIDARDVLRHRLPPVAGAGVAAGAAAGAGNGRDGVGCALSCRFCMPIRSTMRSSGNVSLLKSILTSPVRFALTSAFASLVSSTELFTVVSWSCETA